MFEAVRKNKRFAQIILGLIACSFALVGFEYFGRGDNRPDVAKIGRTSISAAEFENTMRNRPPEEKDTPAMRAQILNSLVNQRLLDMYSDDNRLAVPTQVLQQYILTYPAFQSDGQFSRELYDMYVKRSGMPLAVFERALGQEARISQIFGPIQQAGLASDASAQRLMQSFQQEREIRELRFSPAQYSGKITLPDNAASDYYQANLQKFERPARLQAQYIVLDEQAMRVRANVTQSDVEAAYKANSNEFGQPEEREIRHILIMVPEKAEAEIVEAARAKTADILAKLRKDPKQFTKLAQEFSQDPGSAARGGDLGFSARGAMVAAFDDAAFSLKQNEISEPVRSEFGFHIIEVTRIRPATILPLEKVHAQIEDKLRSQQVAKLFAELAPQFSNMVYEQGDDFEALAEQFKLKINESAWTTRDTPVIGPYHSPQLVAALFSDESLQAKRTTPAIEVGMNTLVAARVTHFEPSQQLPLEEVKAKIVQLLQAEAAKQKAEEEGKAVLAALNKGENNPALKWGDAKTVQRSTPGIAPDGLKAIFAAPVNTLPAYASATLPDNSYAIYRIDAVKQPVQAENDMGLQNAKANYMRLTSEYDVNAFMKNLQKHYPVETNLPAAQEENNAQ